MNPSHALSLTPVAGDLNAMGRQLPAKEQPQSKVLEWAKLITQITAAITICGLLISIGDKLAGYKYEVAKLNETQSKILLIYERREDAGRAALQAEIDRLELELKNPKPVERRKVMTEQLTALKERLKVSKDNSHQLTGDHDITEAR